MAIRTRFQRQDPRHTKKTIKGWTGVVRAIAPDTVDPSSVLQNALNLRPANAAAPSGWLSRPGFTRKNNGVNFSGVCFGILQFTTTTFSYPVGIWNGTLYRLDTNTAITPTGIVIAAGGTGPIFMSVFNSHWLVVSDGVHAPWYWDGITVGATYILFDGVTNEPAYGPVATYYGQMFMIRGSDRTTMVWCEVNAPGTGYVQTGYQDRWQLYQTAGDPLTALFGTNDALYVFRPHSITKVSGQVFSNFSSTGTREGVSEQIGCLAGGSIISLGGSSENPYFGGANAFVFQDQYGRPWRHTPGVGLEPMWKPMIATNYNFPLLGTGQEAGNAIAGGCTAYAPQIDLLIFNTLATGVTGIQQADVFTTTLQYCGSWASSTAFTGGGRFFTRWATIVLGGASTLVMADDQGYWYAVDPTVFTDNDGTTNRAYAKQMALHQFPYDESVEWVFDQINLGVECVTGTSVSVLIQTPRVPAGDTYVATASTDGLGTVVGVGSAQWGLSELARYAFLTFSDGASPVGTMMRFFSVSVDLIFSSDDPLNP